MPASIFGTPAGLTSFRLYLAVNFISLNGLWINRIVVGWLAWSFTGSATWVGLVSALLFAPTVLAGPLFGVVADRVDIKRATMTTQALLAAIMLALLLVHTAGALDIYGLAAIAFLFGLTQSANHPIRLTLVPLLVPQEEIPRAITAISINFNIARLIGPALGGLLIDRLGPGTAMLASLLAMLPVLVAILYLKPRQRPVKDGPRRPLLADLADGTRHVSANPLIRQAMLVTLIAALTARGALEVLPAVADGMFSRGAHGLGQMLSAAGAGALVTGISIMLRDRDRPPAWLIKASWIWMIVGILAVILLPLVDIWWAALGFVFVMGSSGTFTSVYTQSAIQLETADSHRGRVVSLWLFVGMGANAAGALLFGAVADRVTMPMALFGLGAASLAVSLALMARVFAKG